MQETSHRKGREDNAVRPVAMTRTVVIVMLTVALGVIGFLTAGSVARRSLRVFLCIGGWLGVVGDAVSEVDAEDGHGGRPVVTGAPVRLGALDR